MTTPSSRAIDSIPPVGRRRGEFGIDDRAAGLLACPLCGSDVRLEPGRLSCHSCSRSMEIVDGVILTGESGPSMFDEPSEVMDVTDRSRTYYRLFKERQNRVIEGCFRPEAIVLDVGCGRKCQYARPDSSVVVGLEPSFAAIRDNAGVDLRIAGTAQAIPLKNNSVDAIVCAYSLHHMVGGTVSRTRQNVRKAFEEFRRVLKPGGDLLIFEVVLVQPVDLLQRLWWNALRSALGRRLDMFFWSCSDLARLVGRLMPTATPTRTKFGLSPWWTMLYPVLALPWLRIPRLLYPMRATLLRWKMAEGSDDATAGSSPGREDVR